jgi:hypothetical protein
LKVDAAQALSESDRVWQCRGGLCRSLVVPRRPRRRPPPASESQADRRKMWTKLVLFVGTAACFVGTDAFQTSCLPIHHPSFDKSNKCLGALRSANFVYKPTQIRGLRCKESGQSFEDDPNDQWLKRGYTYATITWSTACAARLISPLPWEAVTADRAVNLLSCTTYALFLFIVNALTKAAAKSLENGGKGKGTLASDTYKRLNLALFWCVSFPRAFRTRASPPGARARVDVVSGFLQLTGRARRLPKISHTSAGHSPRRLPSSHGPGPPAPWCRPPRNRPLPSAATLPLRRPA